MAAVTTKHWFLAAMIIVGSGIGLYYYLRVMVVMYMTPPDAPRVDAVNHWGQKVGGIMVLLSCACSACDWYLSRSSDYKYALQSADYNLQSTLASKWSY